MLTLSRSDRLLARTRKVWCESWLAVSIESTPVGSHRVFTAVVTFQSQKESEKDNKRCLECEFLSFVSLCNVLFFLIHIEDSLFNHNNNNHSTSSNNDNSFNRLFPSILLTKLEDTDTYSCFQLEHTLNLNNAIPTDKASKRITAIRIQRTNTFEYQLFTC